MQKCTECILRSIAGACKEGSNGRKARAGRTCTCVLLNVMTMSDARCNCEPVPSLQGPAFNRGDWRVITTLCCGHMDVPSLQMQTMTVGGWKLTLRLTTRATGLAAQCMQGRVLNSSKAHKCMMPVASWHASSH